MNGQCEQSILASNVKASKYYVMYNNISTIRWLSNSWGLENPLFINWVDRSKARMEWISDVFTARSV
jgi:hypothetical protein